MVFNNSTSVHINKLYETSTTLQKKKKFILLIFTGWLPGADSLGYHSYDIKMLIISDLLNSEKLFSLRKI